MMGNIRIIVGIVMLIVGITIFVNSAFNNTLDLTKSVEPVKLESAFRLVIIGAITVALGVAITGWAIRTVYS